MTTTEIIMEAEQQPVQPGTCLLMLESVFFFGHFAMMQMRRKVMHQKKAHRYEKSEPYDQFFNHFIQR